MPLGRPGPLWKGFMSWWPPFASRSWMGKLGGAARAREAEERNRKREGWRCIAAVAGAAADADGGLGQAASLCLNNIEMQYIQFLILEYIRRIAEMGVDCKKGKLWLKGTRSFVT